MEVRHGPITITFRRATIRDGWLREFLTARLQDIYSVTAPAYVLAAIPSFARIVSQVDKAEALPFALVSDTDTDEAIQQAFECWIAQDEAFGDQCWRAIESLRKPADPAAVPLPKDADPNAGSAAKS